MVTPPRFTRKMVDTGYKLIGDKVKLDCAASGTPTPNITWYKDDKLFSRSNAEFKRWSLSFNGFQQDDEGAYMCVVCNIGGCIRFTTDFLTGKSFSILLVSPYFSVSSGVRARTIALFLVPFTLFSYASTTVEQSMQF